MSSELTHVQAAQEAQRTQVSVARGRMCDWLWNGACLETPDWPSYCLKESRLEAFLGKLYTFRGHGGQEQLPCSREA